MTVTKEKRLTSLHNYAGSPLVQHHWFSCFTIVTGALFFNAIVGGWVGLVLGFAWALSWGYWSGKKSARLKMRNFKPRIVR